MSGIIKKIQGGAVALAVIILCVLGAVPAFADGTEKTAAVAIPVTCSGSGTDETFTYTLTGSDSEYETITEGTLHLKTGGKDAFMVEYTYPGEYHLKAAQKKGNDTATSYDNTVYEVTVYVTEDEDGKMAAEAVAYIAGQTDKKASLSFTNTKAVKKTTSSKETSVPKDGTKTSGSVKTGDLFNLAGWTAFAGTALLLYLFLITRKRTDGDS